MTAPQDETLQLLGAGDAALFRALLGVFARAFDEPETYLSRQPSDGYLDRLLAEQRAFAVVAIQADTVVGGLVAYEYMKFEQERSEFYIYDLAVERAHRRRGIATRLIGRLRRLAEARGAHAVIVQADHDDPPAIALYARLGVREEVLHFDIPIVAPNGD